MAYWNQDAYTQADLDDLAKGLPPVGHPHYLPIEDRLGLIFDPLTGNFRKKPEISAQEPTVTTAAAKKYQALRAKIADARKQMEETAKGLFTEMSAELFADNPTLQGFSWTQYTPYFNDGDVCTFSAHTDYPTVSMVIDGRVMSWDSNSYELTDEDSEEIRTADHYISMFKNMKGVTSMNVKGQNVAFDGKVITIDGVPAKSRDDYRKQFDSLEEKVSEFLGTFESEDLETMFGDHVEVTVNRDGTIETEEYSHD